MHLGGRCRRVAARILRTAATTTGSADAVAGAVVHAVDAARLHHQQTEGVVVRAHADAPSAAGLVAAGASGHSAGAAAALVRLRTSGVVFQAIAGVMGAEVATHGTHMGALDAAMVAVMVPVMDAAMVAVMAGGFPRLVLLRSVSALSKAPF